MARPSKDGLSYFPLDTDITEDEKVLYLESETGLEGFAIYVKLLSTIYRNNYYMMWTEMQLGIYSKRFFVDKNTLSKVVSVCKNVGLFDETLFEKYHILTSRGIQNRYLMASERRTGIEIVDEFCLVDREKLLKSKKVKLISVPKKVIAYKNADSDIVSVDNNSAQQGLMCAKTPQSKVNKSKVNKGSIIINNSTKYINSGDVVDNSQDVVDNSTEHTQDEILGKVFQAYESNIHPVATPVEQDRIAELYSEFGGEWLLKAIEVAALNRGKTVRYIEAILHKWGTMPCGTVPWENAKPPDKKASRVEQNLQAAQKAIDFFENGGGSL